MSSTELRESGTIRTKKKSPTHLASILLEPKSIRIPLIRFSVSVIPAVGLIGTMLFFLSETWAIYMIVAGSILLLFSLFQFGLVIVYYRRDNISYQFTKEGLFVRVREHDVIKVPWKNISNFTVYLPEQRFREYHCLIESTEGTVNLDLSHFEEKQIRLTKADHIAQALIMFNNQRLKNLQKKILRG